MEPQNFEDADPNDCPTGMCGTDTFAAYDPTDALGDMDRALGLPDPSQALTIDQIVAQNGNEFAKFWMRFMDAFENAFDREERIKTAALFYPGEGRDGWYQIRFNSPGTPYAASYGWTDHVSNSGGWFSTQENAIFATTPANIFRSVDTIEFYANRPLSALSGADLEQAARRLKQALNIEQDFARWAGFALQAAIIILTTAALVTGVGAVVAAASLTLRAAAILVLVLDMSDAVQVGTGYLGYNEGRGVNPLEEAAAFLGGSLGDEDGEKAARTAYSVINIGVGLKGKWRALAVLPIGVNYLLPPADATVVEEWQD